MRCAIAVALVLVGCGGAQEAEPTTPARSDGPTLVVAVQSNPLPVALPAHSLWRGRYQCAQGVTGLALTLDLDANGRATAVFDFGALPENPTVPSGRYLLAGTFAPLSDRSWSIELAPDRWIAQPPGYVMVGISGFIDAPARRLSGRIDNPSCTIVVVERVQ